MHINAHKVPHIALHYIQIHVSFQFYLVLEFLLNNYCGYFCRCLYLCPDGSDLSSSCNNVSSQTLGCECQTDYQANALALTTALAGCLVWLRIEVRELL